MGSLYFSEISQVLSDRFAMYGYQLQLIMMSLELVRVLFWCKNLSLRDPAEHGDIKNYFPGIGIWEGSCAQKNLKLGELLIQ